MVFRTLRQKCCVYRQLFLALNDVLGHWELDWNYAYDELKEPPTFTPKGICVKLKVMTTFFHQQPLAAMAVENCLLLKLDNVNSGIDAKCVSLLHQVDHT
jgi:hypothetical protein